MSNHQFFHKCDFTREICERYIFDIVDNGLPISCPECGAMIPSRCKYCAFCGSRFNKIKKKEIKNG